MRDLLKKLDRIESATAIKALRSAALLSTTPAIKAMKLAIPVGKDTHRTYKGRLVAPGFAKRSIKRVAKIEKGKLVVRIGVKAEAFYAVQFVERGTRHMSARPWLQRTFESNQKNMERRFRDQLKRKIEKIARA